MDCRLRNQAKQGASRAMHSTKAFIPVAFAASVGMMHCTSSLTLMGGTHGNEHGKLVGQSRT